MADLETRIRIMKRIIEEFGEEGYFHNESHFFTSRKIILDILEEELG